MTNIQALELLSFLEYQSFSLQTNLNTSRECLNSSSLEKIPWNFLQKSRSFRMQFLGLWFAILFLRHPPLNEMVEVLAGRFAFSGETLQLTFVGNLRLANVSGNHRTQTWTIFAGRRVTGCMENLVNQKLPQIREKHKLENCIVHESIILCLYHIYIILYTCFFSMSSLFDPVPFH